MKFLNHLQFEENEARKMKLYRVGATGYTPSVSAAGNVIFDTGDSIPKWWDGSNWRDFSHGTSGGVLYDLLVAQNSGSNNNPKLRLDPSSGSNDDITITGGSNVTVTRTSATGITIAATDTNTNQLTTFTLAGDSGTGQTIEHGDTLTIEGGNAIVTEASATDTVVVNHADTSSQASSNNSGRTYIQDITLDTYGHVTAIGTATETVTNTNTQNEYSISADDGTTTAREKIVLSGTGAAGNTTDFIEIAAGTGLSIARSSDVITLTNTVTNTNTQNAYSVSIPSSTTKLRLSGSGAAGNTTDDIEFVGSGATTVTRTNDSKFTISSTDTNTTYSMMTSSTLGLGKLFSNTTQTVGANSVSETENRTYGIQKNSSNQLVVNVPWSDTNTNTTYDLSLASVSSNETVLTLDASSGDDDTVSFKGTTNEIAITTPATGDAGTVQIGLPDDVTIGNDLTVTTDLSVGNDVVITGDLTVNGTTTTVNSNTVEIGDSIITLNSDETGTPSQNAGIEIERGTATNQSLLWNESTDKWSTYDGSTYVPIIQDLYKNFAAQTGGTASANTTTDTLTLSGANGLATSRSGDTITFTAATNVTAATIDASDMDTNTTATITHGFGTKDVIVELWEVGDTTNSKVEANVTCAANTVAVTFSTTPTVDVRVVIMAAKVLADNSIAYS